MRRCCPAESQSLRIDGIYEHHKFNVCKLGHRLHGTIHSFFSYVSSSHSAVCLIGWKVHPESRFKEPVGGSTNYPLLVIGNTVLEPNSVSLSLSSQQTQSLPLLRIRSTSHSLASHS